MERTTNSDIEVVVKFKGISSVEDVPDFEFAFYTEMHKDETVVCSKAGGAFVNCVVEEFPQFTLPYCQVKCMLENHNLKPGRLCVHAHIKWTDPDYSDGVRNDRYRKKLDLIIVK